MAAATEAFAREPLPRLCNLDRLLHAMEARGLDGIVGTLPHNVFYLTSFNGVAHKADEPRPYAVIFSRAAPEHPGDGGRRLLSRDLPDAADLGGGHPALSGRHDAYGPAAAARDIDRFIPAAGAGVDWLERARHSYSFDMAGAVRDALRDLGLERGRVAFDDMGFGFRLGLEHLTVVDGTIR
jgi:hypothetical protein